MIDKEEAKRRVKRIERISKGGGEEKRGKRKERRGVYVLGEEVGERD